MRNAGKWDENINLSKLSDLQNTYLTQLSYLDVNTFGKRRSKLVGIEISELSHFLLNPSLPFCGSMMMSKEQFDIMTSPLLGDYILQTDAELLNYLVEIGLGELTIIGVESNAESGFQATAFRDGVGNVGISFRGSDLDISSGAIKDWVEADFFEYFTNDSVQRRAAINFFNLHKSANSNNYLYGHSLGGNLASHVYAEYYNEIASVFTINGYPINQALLNSKEKISAFNSDKYVCCSICGDVVSHLKSSELYKDNVRFIKHNWEIKPSLLSAHLVQSASFRKSGEFELATREDAVKSLGKFDTESVKLAQSIREILNELEKRIEHSKILATTSIDKYKKA